ncbi:hypothetical protein [Raineyella sp.]|uniref:hypothetical protein n=1 Tax=Raineyella sp. TaxID=1911550 RepID=UPI002B218DB4|nr:hypothetical protein [Raineyella sp.]MEA5153436.1 hypothetical protein [Raineyella sp.]
MERTRRFVTIRGVLAGTNADALIHQYLPKGTEVASHQLYLDAIAEGLNDSRPPPAVLGYRITREAFERLLLDQAIPSTRWHRTGALHFRETGRPVVHKDQPLR